VILLGFWVFIGFSTADGAWGIDGGSGSFFFHLNFHLKRKRKGLLSWIPVSG
jgi:hypothetical protein